MKVLSNEKKHHSVSVKELIKLMLQDFPVGVRLVYWKKLNLLHGISVIGPERRN